MIRPDFSDVYILRGVYQRRPEQYVKPQKEHCMNDDQLLVLSGRNNDMLYVSPVAFKAAMFVEPRNSAVSAASKIKDITHPEAPMRRKVRLPNLST